MWGVFESILAAVTPATEEVKSAPSKTEKEVKNETNFDSDLYKTLELYSICNIIKIYS